MTKTDFLEAVGEVGEDAVRECLEAAPRRGARWTRIVPAVAAACAAIVCGVLLWHSPFPSGQEGTDPREADGFVIRNGVLLAYEGEADRVTIPDGVTEIADGAFRENARAAQITAVRLGASVVKVGVNAFAGLSALEEIGIAEENGAFAERDGMLCTADGTLLLRYVGEGTEYAIPEGVLYIAAHAFQDAPLETVTFPDGLLLIGCYAFADCRSLARIDLPASVAQIDEGAFSGCGRAVDGSVPVDVILGRDAFSNVPFFLTMLAGTTSPLEAVVRGTVAPSEAIRLSDTAALLTQIGEILAFYGGEGTGEGSFAYGAIAEAPPLPEGAVLPEAVTMEDLSFTDRGWGKTGVYDMQITLPLGGAPTVSMVMEAYLYAPGAVLYWKDASFRIARVYFTEDAEAAAPAAAGWSVVFDEAGREGAGLWTGITFYHEDGRIVRCAHGWDSVTEYRLTFSPDGTRCAVEYDRGDAWCLGVQALNGDRFEVSRSDYVEYLNRYFGAYVPGALAWEDENTLRGQNENGAFSWDLREVYPTQLG